MSELRIQLPHKLEGLLAPKRFKSIHGGRGSGKSHSVAQVLLARGMVKPERYLCAREVQKSLKESVHQLLCDYINKLGLEKFYTPLRDSIQGRNGTRFMFAGLQDHTADSIKSFEGVDVAWVEEAQSVSKRSLEILTPTIRNEGSEVWFTWNPTLEEDEIYQRSIVQQPDPADWWVQEINWRDNPWFPEVLKAEKLQLELMDHDTYMHVWEGKCRSLAGLMFKRHWFRFYDQLPQHLNLYIASDYAVTPDDGDFTEHGVFGMDKDGNLYVVDWWSGQADPAVWIDAWLGLVRQYRPDRAFEEKGVILRAVDSAISKRMRETGVYVIREGLPSASNKAARALGFAARASAGAVYLPKDKPWATRLLNQLCSFHGQGDQVDDMVDVCSLAARGLDSMWNAVEPPKPAPEPDFGALPTIAELMQPHRQESW